MVASADRGLKQRRLYLPRMTDCGTEAVAAAFRSAGLDAQVLPPPDGRSLDLGVRYLAGDECLPAKVTLGDFLKVAEQPGFDPGRVAFMMPTTEGPCRFGQYAPFIQQAFGDLGYPEVRVLSPTSGDGYQELGADAPAVSRKAWRAVVTSDILRKLLLKTRPYARSKAAAQSAYRDGLRAVCAALEQPGLTHRRHLALLVETLTGVRDAFRALAADYHRDRLLIGIQGEIFCRMEEFSNDDVILRLEAQGAEAWLSDIAEWVWYCNIDQEENARHAKGRYTISLAATAVRDYVQRRDQHALLAPFADDFRGYEDPEDVREVLGAGARYLPRSGAAGEMVLSAGKVEHFFRRGADGVLDVSPFSCMNGIVSEALYPRQTAEHAGMPIKNIYVDGTDRDLNSALEIFLELARAYRDRKPVPRRYPPCFA